MRKVKNKSDKESTSFSKKMAESMEGVFARRKSFTTPFYSLKGRLPTFIDFDPLLLQATFGIRGLVPGTIFEIIGPDSVGKTTLCFQIMGDAARQGCVSLYLNSQNKYPPESWLLRCLSRNPKEADQILSDNIISHDVYTIESAVEVIDTFARELRSNQVYAQYANKPAIIVLDSFSKLQPPDLAKGFVTKLTVEPVAKDKKITKKSGKLEEMMKLSEVGNFGTAKMAANWTKRLPYLLSTYNLLLVVISDQTARINMSPGFQTFGAKIAAADESTNRTKPGGRAFNTSSCYQITLTPHGSAYNNSKPPQVIGKQIKMAVVKNSLGKSSKNFCEYDLREVFPGDNPDYLEPALAMDESFVHALAEKGLLELQVRDGLFSSGYLGMTSSTPREIYDKIRNEPALVNYIAKCWNIYGYDLGETVIAAASEPEAQQQSEVEDTEVEEGEAP